MRERLSVTTLHQAQCQLLAGPLGMLECVDRK
jgi:hypothetical protein